MAQTEEEVEMLTRLKAGRMKELVLKRRLELENICRSMHVEPDASTVPEKSIALIDSGTSSEFLFTVLTEMASGSLDSNLLTLTLTMFIRPRESF